MTLTPAQIHELLVSEEDEHLELKEAKSSYSSDKPVDDCAALAPAGGGRGGETGPGAARRGRSS